MIDPTDVTQRTRGRVAEIAKEAKRYRLTLRLKNGSASPLMPRPGRTD